MKIIHLINDFNSNFYLDLFSNFKADNHLILSSVRNKEYKLSSDYSHLNVTHKYFKFRIFVLLYFFNIIKIFSNNPVIIHTHNSSVEGLISLMCKKILGIEFIFTVRNTEVNFIIKNIFGKILFNYMMADSKYIVLKNKSYKKFIPIKYHHKIKFIPNGLNQFWIDNFNPKQNITNNLVNILCVADLYCNKNHKNLLKAVDSINKDQIICTLTLVAREEGDCKYDILEKIKNIDYVYLKKSLNRTELLNEYRKADIFCMCSFHETFGLVYLEALSQQVPIIYTKNEGVDGLIPANYGNRSSTDSLSIEKSIIALLNKIKQSKPILIDEKFIKSFQWNKIAVEYESLYF